MLGNEIEPWKEVISASEWLLSISFNVSYPFQLLTPSSGVPLAAKGGKALSGDSTG